MNTKSSCTDPKSSLRLVDVVIALLQRERIEEAIEHQFEAVMLSVEHNLSVEDIMKMSVDEMTKLYVVLQQPQVPSIPPVLGWDRVWYGEAAFKEDEE